VFQKLLKIVEILTETGYMNVDKLKSCQTSGAGQLHAGERQFGTAVLRLQFLRANLDTYTVEHRVACRPITRVI